MQVKSIAECSNGSILQYFRPSLSYHLSLRIFEWPFYRGFTVHTFSVVSGALNLSEWCDQWASTYCLSRTDASWRIASGPFGSIVSSARCTPNSETYTQHKYMIIRTDYGAIISPSDNIGLQRYSYLTIPYLSRYLPHDTIRIAIHFWQLKNLRNNIDLWN